MWLSLIIACLFAHHGTFAVAHKKTDKDDLYYNYYDYNYFDENPTEMKLPSGPSEGAVTFPADYYSDKNPTEMQIPVKPHEGVLAVVAEHIETGFRAQVTCSSNHMTMVIDRRALPLGLGFADAVFESQTESDDIGSISCVRATRNSTHYVYKVEVKCSRAVGVSHDRRRTIYTHEFSLNDVTPKKSRKQGKPYSIIMDCSTTLDTRSSDAPEGADWTATYRVFEHRIGGLCAADCPHGELCLPETDLDGFFCDCASPELSCGCPDAYYGCAGGQNETARNLVCVRNSVLCDSRHDCPLKDDEECSDKFGPWSYWSECSSPCGDGTQTRQKRCEIAFTKDPLRSRKPCSHSTGAEEQSRHCSRGTCSSVECETDAMRIKIPMELGMTKKSVKERMRLRNAKRTPQCRPQLNETHVTFVIPLHDCNTSTWVDGDIVIYSNAVVYEVETEESDIIVREYGHSYTAKCQYKRRQTISLRPNVGGQKTSEVAALKFERSHKDGLVRDADMLDMITHYSSGDGVFEYHMDIYTDSFYTTRYTSSDYPLEKRLGEKMYIAVNFKSQDEDLNVFIERCWAVSSSEIGTSNDDATYLFINGGCPVDPTVQFHDDKTNHFSDRYSIESFKFNDAQYSFIYFRCDVIVCDASEDDPACERVCPPDEPSKRRKRDVSGGNHARSRVTQGPVVILEEWDKPKRRLLGSEVGIGSVEHEIITLDDARKNKASDRIVMADSESGMRSPYLLPAIAGSVCLIVGLSLGLLLRRKNTTSAGQSPKADKSRQNGYVKGAPLHDEETTAMAEKIC